MAPRTLYIIYNADASIIGKFNYAYRKLTAPKDAPACAACDITHGGLHLNEAAEWKSAKEEIAREAENLVLKQLHRDEMGGEVRVPVFLSTFIPIGVTFCAFCKGGERREVGNLEMLIVVGNID